MSENWFLTSRSLLLSIALHIGIGFVLVFNFEWSPTPLASPEPVVNIIDAVSVDKNQLERELKRLQKKEDAEKADQIRRKKEREALQQKEAQLRQIQQEKKQRKQAELKRKEEHKKELEKKRRREEQKQAERKKQDAERKKKEAEKKRQLEAKKKQKEREKQLQEQLAAELAAEQDRQDASEIKKFTRRIARVIEGRFNKLGLPDGLSCVISIRLLEDGKVADVSIARSSGHDLFDKRAESAVHAASPLPVPNEKRIFRKMRHIELTFKP